MMRTVLRFATTLLLLPALSFAATKPGAKKKPVDTSNDDQSETSTPFPAYTGTGFPVVHAGSVVVLDASSGHILHELNADQPRPVASTQKLLTSLIVAETGNLDAQVHVEAIDTFCEPSKLDIKAGEVYRRGDLLRVLLVKSENDVARCLARDNAGSIEAFAARMNAKAAALGMTSSHFENPNGLPIPGQYSTARDMAKLAFAAYHNRTIRSCVCLKDLAWTSPSGRTTLFHNTNHVLRSFPLCNGMKTGYTEAAGHCLVSSAAANGREVISVALGDNKDIWIDSYRLLNWGLSNGSVARN